MSLTSSIVHALEQPDGRKLVQEKHVDQDGTVYPRFYTAAAGADLGANLDGWAASLAIVLAEREADEVMR